MKNGGVYVLKTELSGATGYYVGKSQNGIWSRIRKHFEKGGDWKEKANIGHNLKGIEVVFLMKGSYEPFFCKNNQMECLVTKAMMERYGRERVYGAGYTKQRPATEKYDGYQATPEFIETVSRSDWNWILKYLDRIVCPIDSPHNTNYPDKNNERVWRIVKEPTLP